MRRHTVQLKMTLHTVIICLLLNKVKVKSKNIWTTERNVQPEMEELHLTLLGRIM